MIETTLILIKPDGVERCLIEEIKDLINSEFDCRIKTETIIDAKIERTREHYIDHADKPFYQRITEGLCGQVYAMIWEGEMLYKN